eukprot:2887511-Prymnesium_polylepis.2
MLHWAVADPLRQFDFVSTGTAGRTDALNVAKAQELQPCAQQRFVCIAMRRVSHTVAISPTPGGASARQQLSEAVRRWVGAHDLVELDELEAAPEQALVYLLLAPALLHSWKLVQVAYRDDALTAEECCPSPRPTAHDVVEREVDAVERRRGEHGYFVDDDHVSCCEPDEAIGALRTFEARYIEPAR